MFSKVSAINIIPRNLAGSQSPSVLLYQLILHNYYIAITNAKPLK